MKKFYWLISVAFLFIYSCQDNKERQKEKELQRIEESFDNALTIDKNIENKRDSIYSNYSDNELFGVDVIELNSEKQ
jgi:hypothetical protein